MLQQTVHSELLAFSKISWLFKQTNKQKSWSKLNFKDPTSTNKVELATEIKGRKNNLISILVTLLLNDGIKSILHLFLPLNFRCHIQFILVT